MKRGLSNPGLFPFIARLEDCCVFRSCGTDLPEEHSPTRSWVVIGCGLQIGKGCHWRLEGVQSWQAHESTLRWLPLDWLFAKLEIAEPPRYSVYWPNADVLKDETTGSYRSTRRPCGHAR